MSWRDLHHGAALRRQRIRRAAIKTAFALHIRLGRQLPDAPFAADLGLGGWSATGFLSQKHQLCATREAIDFWRELRPGRCRYDNSIRATGRFDQARHARDETRLQRNHNPQSEHFVRSLSDRAACHHAEKLALPSPPSSRRVYRPRSARLLFKQRVIDGKPVDRADTSERPRAENALADFSIGCTISLTGESGDAVCDQSHRPQWRGGLHVRPPEAGCCFETLGVQNIRIYSDSGI